LWLPPTGDSGQIYNPHYDPSSRSSSESEQPTTMNSRKRGRKHSFDEKERMVAIDLEEWC